MVVPELLATLIEGVKAVVTTMVIVLLVPVTGEGQAALEVSTQLITSLLIKALELYVAPPVPTFAPFFFH